MKNIINFIIAAIIAAFITLTIIFFACHSGYKIENTPAPVAHKVAAAGDRAGKSGLWTYECVSGVCSIEQKLYVNKEYFGKIYLTRASKDTLWNLGVIVPVNADTRKPAELRLPIGMNLSLPWNGCKAEGCVAEHASTENETFHLREARFATLHYKQSDKSKVAMNITLMGEKAAMRLAEEALEMHRRS